MVGIVHHHHCIESADYQSSILFTDVDVPKPDEKSIITYVSSLYDVFPDVPSVEQSLKDNVSKWPLMTPVL